MKITAGVVALILAAVAPLWSQTTLYSIGQPTDEEQLYVEMINRARANPTAEGVLLANSGDPDVISSIDFHDVDVPMMKSELAALPVRPPLAINAKLTQMARGHTQDMFDHAFQGHTSSNGNTLGQRLTAVSYPAATAGENVFSFAESVFQGHAGFQIDWGEGPGGMQTGRGHRMNIHGSYREVGAGVLLGTHTVGDTTVGPQLVTQNFGTQLGSLAYVTGVAYYDLNGNGFYDLGEGIGGLTVNVNGASFHTVTANSGGYAVPVPTANATRAVTFSGLGLNGGGNATITNGENFKVDFKTAYSAPAVTGPSTAATGNTSTYTFNGVGGASGYEWQVMKITAVGDDDAENLTRVTPATTGSYTPRSTSVKHAGNSAYRLTHPAVAFSSETLTYAGSFLVQADASLSFRSRLRMASQNQAAKVEVSSDNGMNWSAVYTQAGATPPGQNGLPGETSFQLRTVSLSSFAGQQVKIRFNYDFSGGSLFAGTADTFGWFVDEVKFTNMLDPSKAVITSVVAGQTEFGFTPSEPGAHLLSVRPRISGRSWAFGPSLAVTVELGTGFFITEPPRSKVVKIGALAEFGVSTSLAADSYQWFKGGSAIPGAVGAALKINPATLKDAGSYSVQAKQGAVTRSSDPFLLGVVEDVPKTVVLQAGKAVTLTANAAGPELKYEWKKNGQSLGQAKTLSLQNLTSAQSGTYICEVKVGNSDATAGATTVLRIFDSPPAILPVQGMLDGIVGGVYVHQIKFSDASAVIPTAFAAKNLPAGLKINAKTGEITGRPTKAGTFEVTLIASNAFGPSQTTDEIVIQEYPVDLAGNYVGGIERSLTNPLQQTGGRLDLVITSLGAFSGSVTQGAAKMAFKGLLDIPLSGGGFPSGEVLIQPPGKPAPAVIKLAFSVNFETHRLVNASVTQSAESVAVTAWHQKWSDKGPQATAYLKLHTFGLRLADAGLVGDADIPQGWGYGSFTPAVDGKVSVAGRTADGEKFTCASFIGPAGEVLIYQPLYTTAIKGSLLGALIVNANNTLDPDDNTILGGVTWTRPASNAVNARTYKAGFGLAGTPEPDPVVLEATGARHVPPTGTQVILNLPAAGTQNAHADFGFGDIASSSDNPDPASLSIEAKSKITVAGPNPAALKLTANATTGILGGSFALTDAPGPGATDVKRSVTLQGILIRDGNDYLGVGYFLLPALPSQAVPVNTTILSGSMTLRKN